MASFLPLQPFCGSGDDIGQQLALDQGDLVFQRQFTLFQPLHLQGIESLGLRKTVDHLIEVPVFAFEILKFEIKLVGIVHLFGLIAVLRFAPTVYVAAIEAEKIENAADIMIDHLVQALRPGIKRRHRRRNNGAKLGGAHHIADMPGMKWRFPHHQDQAAAFLQHHVGRAGQEMRGDAGGDLGQTAHRTRGDDHAQCLERAAGYGGAHIVVAMGVIGQGVNILRLKVALAGQGHFRRLAHDQMSFNGLFFQHLKKADAVHHPRGAADSDDKP